MIQFVIDTGNFCISKLLSSFIYDINTSIMSVIRPSPYIFCFSLIFSQQEDKSELQGATLNFLPWQMPTPVKDWLPLNSPIIQREYTSYDDAIRLLLPTASVIHEFLHFKAKCIIWIPYVVSVSRPISHRVIPTQWASIAAPRRVVLFKANSSAICVAVDDSIFSQFIAKLRQFALQVSLLRLAEPTTHLEALTRFVHRVDHRHDSNIDIVLF